MNQMLEKIQMMEGRLNSLDTDKHKRDQQALFDILCRRAIKVIIRGSKDRLVGSYLKQLLRERSDFVERVHYGTNETLHRASVDMFINIIDNTIDKDARFMAEVAFLLDFSMTRDVWRQFSEGLLGI
jgi:hypothetical protein